MQRIEELKFAEFYYNSSFLRKPEEIFQWLYQNLPWEQHTINMNGQDYLESRQKILLSNRSNNPYADAGYGAQIYRFPQIVELIRQCVSEICGVQFDTCLVNLYRDGNDKIGMHADKETSLVPGEPIASVSLGAERHFDLHLKPMSDTRGSAAYHPNHGQTEPPKYRLDLANGSLLIMGKDSQRNYLHGVPVQKKIKESRINLTFRVTKKDI